MAVRYGHFPPHRRLVLAFSTLSQFLCGTLECYQLFSNENYAEIQCPTVTNSSLRVFNFPGLELVLSQTEVFDRKKSRVLEVSA